MSSLTSWNGFSGRALTAAVLMLQIWLVATPASATNCSAFTYNLVNNTPADASQVMANFNTLMNCANNNLLPISGGTWTGGALAGTTSLPGSGAITSSGSIGLGTSTPTEALEVYNSINGEISSLVYNNTTGANVEARFTSSTGTANSYIISSLKDNSGSPYYLLAAGAAVRNSYWQMPNFNFQNVSGASQLYLNGAGDIGIATVTPSYPLQVNGAAAATSFVTTSDARQKRDIKELSGDAGAIIAHLRPVTFRWRADKDDIGSWGRQIGFIAQEVRSVVPEATVEGNDPAKTLGIKYDDLIPILTKAIQEQQREIVKLSTIVDTLKAANNNFKQKMDTLYRDNMTLDRRENR